jgi:hypothetical protein
MASDAGRNEREEFSAILSSVRDDLRSNGAGLGRYLGRLIEVADMWHSPSGLIAVRGSSQGGRVILSGTLVGINDLDIRVSPGRYSIAILRSGVAVFKLADIVVGENQITTVKIPP